MSFPRYPKYKDSGVEWLGEVPAHWDVISIKWLSPVKRGASPRPIDDSKYFDDEGEFAWVRIADVSACDGILYETTQRLSELGSSLSVKITPGELFVSIAGTVGKPCVSAIKACIHDGFVYFPTLKIDPLFLYRVFEGGTCYGGLGKWGTQLNLNTDTIGSIRVALPPPVELKLVLAFLDRETAKIDELVAEQRRLMELLKEKRQAVISHAVTQGLNPNAPMKPTCIEWLGEVPAHWDLKRVRFVAELNPSKSETNELDRDTSVSFLPMEAIGENGSLNLDKEKSISEVETGYTYFRDGDVTVAKITPCYENGKGALMCGLLNGIGFGTTELIVARPRPGAVTGIFLHYLFISPDFRYLGESHMYGAGGQKRVPDAFVRDFETAFPPLTEQTLIAAFLDQELAKIDTLTTEAQRAIDLLQERRTALISAAVTGQIDVRNTVSAAQVSPVATCV